METKIQQAVTTLLQELGEDPKREGLQRTPLRVEKSLQFLTHGYSMSVDDILNNALFEEEYDELVICKNIEIFSMCEHHMLPFFGRAHIAYLPDKKIIGLSKLARIADMFARRFQVQERLTKQIAQTLWDALTPRGVAVVIEARHLCMMMRGVEKQNSLVTTSAMLGAFRENRKTRLELLELLKGGITI